MQVLLQVPGEGAACTAMWSVVRGVFWAENSTALQRPAGGWWCLWVRKVACAKDSCSAT